MESIVKQKLHDKLQKLVEFASELGFNVSVKYCPNRKIKENVEELERFEVEISPRSENQKIEVSMGLRDVAFTFYNKDDAYQVELYDDDFTHLDVHTKRVNITFMQFCIGKLPSNPHLYLRLSNVKKIKMTYVIETNSLYIDLK